MITSIRLPLVAAFLAARPARDEYPTDEHFDRAFAAWWGNAREVAGEIADPTIRNVAYAAFTWTGHAAYVEITR